MKPIAAVEALTAINALADWLATKGEPDVLPIKAYAYDSSLTQELPAADIEVMNADADMLNAMRDTDQFVRGRLGFQAIEASNELRGPQDDVVTSISFRTRIVQ